MAEIKTKYGSNTVIDMDLSSLATSATFIAGRESGEIDNTTNLFIDALVKGKVTVGTSPSANSTAIQIYVWGSDESLGTTPIDVLDGVDSDETLTNTGILNNALAFAYSIPLLQNTSDITYDITPFSVKELFGGVMPKFWGLFVAHDTTVNLNATNDDLFSYNGVTFESA